MQDPDAERDHEEMIAPLRRPVVAARRTLRSMGRQMLAFIGLVFVIIGVPLAMITPFPFVPIGLPVVVMGVALLGRNSVWGHALLERMLMRWPSLERFAPNWLMQLVFARPKRVPAPDNRTDSGPR
jgi:hypothetical protein